MARIATVLRVFVASPGDVADARKHLTHVVDELNVSWGREHGLLIELVKWETHAYSDAGDDAQDVINKQLDDYDIFLGVMWKRFGEPTGRAESGTKEEFDNARRRYERDPKQVRLMFFFKSAGPTQLSKVDPKQLEAVNQFRKEVHDAGILYFEYKQIQEFKDLVRRGLSRQMQEWGKSWGGVLEESTTSRRLRNDEQHIGQQPDPEAFRAKSITAIVFEQMASVDKLRHRVDHDPEVIHRSFLEGQFILDSSPGTDEWAEISAIQAAALVIVALASRLEGSDSAKTYVANVCDRILSQRGLQIEWNTGDRNALFEIAAAARDRHDDTVLSWIRERAVKPHRPGDLN